MTRYFVEGFYYDDRQLAIQKAIEFCKKTNNGGMVFYKQNYLSPVGNLVGFPMKNKDGEWYFLYTLKENIYMKLDGLFHINNEPEVIDFLKPLPQTVDELVWCYHEINSYITPNNGCNLEIHIDPETGEKTLWIMVQVGLEQYENGANEQLHKFDSEYYLDKLAGSLVNVNLEFG